MADSSSEEDPEEMLFWDRLKLERANAIAQTTITASVAQTDDGKGQKDGSKAPPADNADVLDKEYQQFLDEIDSIQIADLGVASEPVGQAFEALSTGPVQSPDIATPQADVTSSGPSALEHADPNIPSEQHVTSTTPGVSGQTSPSLTTEQQITSSGPSAVEQINPTMTTAQLHTLALQLHKESVDGRHALLKSLPAPLRRALLKRVASAAERLKSKQEKPTEDAQPSSATASSGNAPTSTPVEASAPSSAEGPAVVREIAERETTIAETKELAPEVQTMQVELQAVSQKKCELAPEVRKTEPDLEFLSPKKSAEAPLCSVALGTASAESTGALLAASSGSADGTFSLQASPRQRPILPRPLSKEQLLFSKLEKMTATSSKLQDEVAILKNELAAQLTAFEQEARSKGAQHGTYAEPDRARDPQCSTAHVAQGSQPFPAAKVEADQRAELDEAERRAVEEGIKKAREEAEQKAKEAAAKRVREEAERKAREELIQRFKEEANEKAKRKAARKAEQKAYDEARRKAKEQEEANREAQRAAKEDAEQWAQRLAERLAKAKAKEDADRRAMEAERKAKEEAERRAKETAKAERKAREKAERRMQEEAEKKAKEDAERDAKEKAARRAKKAERRAREEANIKAKTHAEKIASRAEAKEAEEAAEEKAKEEADMKIIAEAEKMIQDWAEKIEGMANEEAKRNAQDQASIKVLEEIDHIKAASVCDRSRSPRGTIPQHSRAKNSLFGPLARTHQRSRSLSRKASPSRRTKDSPLRGSAGSDHSPASPSGSAGDGRSSSAESPAQTPRSPLRLLPAPRVTRKRITVPPPPLLPPAPPPPPSNEEPRAAKRAAHEAERGRRLLDRALPAQMRSGNTTSKQPSSPERESQASKHVDLRPSAQKRPSSTNTEVPKVVDLRAAIKKEAPASKVVDLRAAVRSALSKTVTPQEDAEPSRMVNSSSKRKDSRSRSPCPAKPMCQPSETVLKVEPSTPRTELATEVSGTKEEDEMPEEEARMVRARRSSIGGA